MDRARVRAHLEERRRIRRAVSAIAVSYAGVLVVVAAGVDLLPAYGLFLGVGAAAALLLGDLRPTFAGPPHPSDGLWGAAGAAAMLGFSLLYALALGARDVQWSVPGAGTILALAALPAVVEEWLCRGVLWEACSRLATPRVTILVTAILFGLVHVLSWGPFGFPTRLLGGVVLGALRARTGGLAAPVLAHLLNNAVGAGFLAAEW